MTRRTFLQFLALFGAGCSQAPSSPNPVPSASASTPLASHSPTPAGDKLLGRAVIRRYTGGVFEDPEVGVWHLWSDGRAEQKAVFPTTGKGSVIAGVPGQNLFFRQEREGDEMVCYRVDEKDQISEVYRAKRPDKLWGSGPFPGSEPMLVSGKYGEEAQITAFGKDGVHDTLKLGAEGEPKNITVSGSWLNSIVNRGFRETKEVDLVLLEIEKGNIKQRLATSLTELTLGGYALGASVCPTEKGLVVSVGVMESETDGDFVAIFEVVDGKLELVQKLQAGFRPPPMRFLKDGRLGLVQDNSGDLYTFIRSGKTWTPAQQLELAANGDYLHLNAEETIIFTKNNPGDILWVGLSDDGKLDGPHVFTDLMWEKEGRKPDRMQHDIVGILAAG